MTEYREGFSSWEHLIDTIVKNTSIPVNRNETASMVWACLERCVEIYVDGKLGGYALVLNIQGQRSFHGYKLIPGNSIKVYRIAKDFLKRYVDISITTTADKYQVRRLGRMLGLKETMQPRNIVCLRK